MEQDFPIDPVIEAYKPGIDRTLIRQNLRRTVDERVRNLVQLGRFKDELQRGMKAERDERWSKR